MFSSSKIRSGRSARQRSLNSKGHRTQEVQDAQRASSGIARPSDCSGRGGAVVARTAASAERRPRADPTDEPRKSAVGAPRIHGELLKLGIDVGETSVSKYM